jgi:hypothetical protein
MADLGTNLKPQCFGGGSSDYSFAKIQVPQFDDDIRHYSKWRSEVKSHFSDMARTTIQKQAVHLLDRLTPSKCDVSKSTSLKEA